jgi:phosphopantetheinyl transferase (holo-ACP synthase)
VDVRVQLRGEGSGTLAVSGAWDATGSATNSTRLTLTGSAATLAAGNGVTNLQLSLSHDGGQAIAFVVAEGSAP